MPDNLAQTISELLNTVLSAHFVFLTLQYNCNHFLKLLNLFCVQANQQEEVERVNEIKVSILVQTWLLSDFQKIISCLKWFSSSVLQYAIDFDWLLTWAASNWCPNARGSQGVSCSFIAFWIRSSDIAFFTEEIYHYPSCFSMSNSV